MYEYKAKIINVVDGDTFDLDIDVGFHITLRERVRLLSVDTPETRGAAEEKRLGLIVKEFAQRYLGDEVRIKSYKGTDSFGRWLVEIIMPKYCDRNLVDIYNELGFNKLDKNYSEEGILDYGKHYGYL